MDESWLNKTHIGMSGDGVEYHPLIPFLPGNAKVLFLGSFPPQRKRWCINFYYPNFINDHWRIEGEVFFADRQHFVLPQAKAFDQEAIVAFCREKGIAFFDTATAVRRLRDNAADEFLEVVQPTDLRALMEQLPHLELIVTTGHRDALHLFRHRPWTQGGGLGAHPRCPQRRRTGGQPLSAAFVLARLPVVV